MQIQSLRIKAYRSWKVDGRGYSDVAKKKIKLLHDFDKLKTDGGSESVILSVLGISRSTFYRIKAKYGKNGFAGLVLVQQGSPLENEPQIWDIAEFFIMRKYRKRGIGTYIAYQVWQQFKGRWQVRVLHENKEARVFWVQAIEKFIRHEVSFTTVTDKDNYKWDIFKFESK